MKIEKQGFVISTPEVAAIPVFGGGMFPVRRVYCIGRNYAAHSIEMGDDPDRDPPFFFQKNANNLDASGLFPYPSKSNDVHYEVEMAIALKTGGRNIPVGDALDHVYGYAPCLDMTRRDLQNAAKAKGRPWEIGKAFEHSGPIGPLQTVEQVGHLSCGRIELLVDGVVKQEGDLSQMIWKVPEIIAYLSEYFELGAGDVIMSGTPAGVDAVEVGDVMVVNIDGLTSLTVKVT
jgi:fumarylpyruvate hydrolase